MAGRSPDEKAAAIGSVTTFLPGSLFNPDALQFRRSVFFAETLDAFIQQSSHGFQDFDAGSAQVPGRASRGAPGPAKKREQFPKEPLAE